MTPGDRRTAWNSTLPERSKPLRSSPWPRPALSVVVAGGAPVVPLVRRRTRSDPIPPKVRRDVNRRDGRYCYVDGRHFPEGGIHLHHRRLKQAGGDPRPHAHCACNLVSICWEHHAWIHDTDEGRIFAEAEGLIIPNMVLEPGTISVLAHGEDDGSGVMVWLTCDGRRMTGTPDGAV